MIKVPLQRYTVRNGDSLDKIARTKGYASWRVIYKSKFNSAFRRQRPNQNQIYPGDIVILPPKTSEIINALRESNNRLTKTKTGILELNNQNIKEINNEFSKVKKKGELVDTAATITLMFVNIANLAKKGIKGLKAGGAELKRINKEVAKDTLQGTRDGAAEKVLQMYTEADIDNNVVTSTTKIVIQAFFDMTSPSFWANTYTNLRGGMGWSEAVTTKPEDVKNKVIKQFNKATDEIIKRIDLRIEENKRLIMEFSKSVEKPLPIKIHPKQTNYLLH